MSYLMGNYVVRARDITHSIRQRLHDYELAGGRTVVRELLQNADDAKATNLRFLLLKHGGLPDARSSLLRGPAFVAVNDGPFAKAHRVAVSSLSTSSKIDDPGAVGRFGIGQQSVFHLCEAFVFAGEGPDGLLLGGLNPWAEGGSDSEHPDWSDADLADDLQKLAEWMRAWAVPHGTPDPRQWFGIWLPLRTDAHRRPSASFLSSILAEKSAAILQQYFETDDLARLLPQAHRLRTVEFSVLDDASKRPTDQGTQLRADAHASPHVGRVVVSWFSVNETVGLI